MIQPWERVSLADFLAWEQSQEYKHELLDGEILAFSGGSFDHNDISLKFAGCWTIASRRRAKRTTPIRLSRRAPVTLAHTIAWRPLTQLYVLSHPKNEDIPD